jgi:hypothetical protein
LRQIAPSQLLTISILLVCLWNAASSLHDNYHWPLTIDDDWTRIEQQFGLAKTTLHTLQAEQIAYRIEEPDASYDPLHYSKLQHILAPQILVRDSASGSIEFVLVEFWTTRRVVPLEGLVLVQDYGNGVGLYRRTP